MQCSLILIHPVIFIHLVGMVLMLCMMMHHHCYSVCFLVCCFELFWYFIGIFKHRFVGYDLSPINVGDIVGFVWRDVFWPAAIRLAVCNRYLLPVAIVPFLRFRNLKFDLPGCNPRLVVMNFNARVAQDVVDVIDFDCAIY